MTRVVNFKKDQFVSFKNEKKIRRVKKTKKKLPELLCVVKKQKDSLSRAVNLKDKTEAFAQGSKDAKQITAVDTN